MNERRFRNRRMISTMLAVWMSVASLGMTVTHSHAMGSSAHVHGYAWNFSHSLVLPTDENERSPEPHSHLILFGIEFPAQNTLDPGPNPSGTSVAPASMTSDCDDPCYFDGWVTSPVDCTSVWNGIRNVDLPQSPLPPRLPIPLTLRAMPGVLRA